MISGRSFTALAAAWMASLLGAFLLNGCSRGAGPPPRVRKAAASDLRCPTAELSYRRLANDAYQIEGCGQRIRYTYACPQGSCQWRREGAPQPAPTELPAR